MGSKTLFQKAGLDPLNVFFALAVARRLENARGVATMCPYRMAYGTNMVLPVTAGTVNAGQPLL